MREDVVYLKRGQIFWRKDPNISQLGILGKSRPVLVVGNNAGLAYSHIVSACPLTTTDKADKKLPTQVPIYFRDQNQYILCEQVYTCNHDQLGDYIGTLSETKMKAVDKALSIALGLPEMIDNTEPAEAEDDEIVPPTVKRKWTIESRKAFVTKMREHLHNGQHYLENEEIANIAAEYGFSSPKSAVQVYERFINKWKEELN